MKAELEEVRKVLESVDTIVLAAAEKYDSGDLNIAVCQLRAADYNIAKAMKEM